MSESTTPRFKVILFSAKGLMSEDPRLVYRAPYTRQGSTVDPSKQEPLMLGWRLNQLLEALRSCVDPAHWPIEMKADDLYRKLQGGELPERSVLCILSAWDESTHDIESYDVAFSEKSLRELIEKEGGQLIYSIT